MTLTTIPTTAIAYTRVSSRRQSTEGQSLSEQRLAIETYAHHSRLRIQEWFEDVASAKGPRSVSRRPGFQGAVDEAEKRGVPIIVASFDRVSRDLQSFMDLVRHREITFISVQDGTCLTLANLEGQIARAEANNRRRSQSAKDEYAQRRILGLPPRNPDLEGARRKSADARGAKALAKAEHLANILRSDPSLSGLSIQKLCDRLNELGQRDLLGGLWTKASIHSAMSRLKKQKAELDALRPTSSDQEKAELAKLSHYHLF